MRRANEPCEWLDLILATVTQTVIGEEGLRQPLLVYCEVTMILQRRLTDELELSMESLTYGANASKW